MERSSGGHGKLEVPVFRPTMEEFKDFPRYIDYIESCGAHKVGLAKVIPPKEWIPRKGGYDNIDIIIPAPIEQQCIYGSKGTFKIFNLAKKPMSVADFAEMANGPKYQTPKNRGYEDLERKFWTNLTINRPIYGADVSGTLTDPNQKLWNCGDLGTILDRIGPHRIEGVNTAYLYFGMWKALFAWHTEDMDLYSINYLHFGATKAWYAIPPEHGRRLERLAAGLFPIDSKECPAFLRHKMFLISPRTLRENSIPFCQMYQEAGEFMITFPYSYHAGYNLGYNCAESTNFASKRWIEYGKRCSQCCCNSDMVRISMDNFVREFQPDRYDLWRAGMDVGSHPEDELSKLYPHHTAARMEKSRRQSAVVLNLRANEETKSHQVSRRIPLSKAPPPQSAGVESPNSDDDADSADSEPIVKRRATPAAAKSVSRRPPPARRASADAVHQRKAATKVAVAADKKPRRQSSNDDRKKPVVKKPRLMVRKLSESGEMRITRRSAASQRIVATGETVVDKEAPVIKSSVEILSQEKSPPVATKAPILSRQHRSSGGVRMSGGSGDFTTISMPHLSPVRAIVGNPLLSEAASAVAPAISPGFSSHSEFLDGCSDVSGSRSVDDLLFFDEANGAFDKEVVETLSCKSDTMLVTKDSTLRRSRCKQNSLKSDRSAKLNIDRRLAVVLDLFQFLPRNFPAEVTYNMQQATQSPHCSVCALFNNNESTNGNVGSSPSGNSKPVIPEEVFACRVVVGQPDNGGQSSSSAQDTNPGQDTSPGQDTNPAQDTSPLCICSRCRVCVHASCYGEPLISGTDRPAAWTCDRCFSGNDADVCCLCELRGGALKRTVDGRWAHLVCALALPDAGFNDQIHRSIVVKEAVSAPRTQTCVYCHRVGLCVTCVNAGCHVTFHVTCGHVAGAKFTVSKLPPGLRVTCPQHQQLQRGRTSLSRSDGNLVPVAIGDHVVAKHRNGRYYRGVVLSATNNVFYKVTFEDGTFSNDMFPEDIVLPDSCGTQLPEVGSCVEVRWVDGNLYKAVFRGVDAANTVEVQFEDGSTLSTARDKVWAECEQLPASVASRLSVATETKYNLFQPLSPSVTPSRTRQVKPQYIRNNDFVELPARI